MWNPKHSAKFVCHIVTSASSIARAGTSCEMEKRRTRNSSSTLLTSSRFPITTSRKDDPTGTVTGRSRGDHEYFTAFSVKKKCKKRLFLGIHDRFIRDEKFRKNMIDIGHNEELCRETDNWRTKTTRTTPLQKKSVCTERIGGSVRTW